MVAKRFRAGNAVTREMRFKKMLDNSTKPSHRPTIIPRLSQDAAA